MTQLIEATTAGVVDASSGVLSLRAASAQAGLIPDDGEIGFTPFVQGQAVVLAGGQFADASNIESGGPVREGSKGSAFALSKFGGPSVDGTIFTVTTAADSVDANDGVLSLREALTLAASEPGADQIEFAAAIQGQTLTLTMGQLSITSDVTINGGFDGVTIDAALHSRVFQVFGKYTDATFAYLTITGGCSASSGGGLRSDNSAITVYACTIADNQTSGEGFHSKGGGISAYFAPATIINSTISGNSAEYSGGSIYGLSITIKNSTITGNSLQNPGNSPYYGQGTIENSIFAGNSGGYRLGGTVYAGWDSHGGNVFGRSLQNSLPNDFQNIDPRAIFQDTYVLPGTSVHAGILAENYGPTKTVALLDAAANPALGGADPAIAPMFDQRGVPRPKPDGTNPDVGAFELSQTPTLISGSNHGERLVGTRHDDLIQGWGGNDRLHGGRGGDRLEGGDGRDRLFGEGGGDLLIGGADADRFVFAHPRHSHGLGRDLVLDFSPEEGDRIDLRRLDADPERPRDQRLKFIGTEPFDAAGQVHYVMEPGRTVVEVNLDHDRHAELQVVLPPDLVLHRNDFLL
ncbi:MAG: choice-of-anchor Q domain-containing protein [Geminicoccaceae bacterium]